jgi:hypothetical protein
MKRRGLASGPFTPMQWLGAYGWADYGCGTSVHLLSITLSPNSQGGFAKDVPAPYWNFAIAHLLGSTSLTSFGLVPWGWSL